MARERPPLRVRPEKREVIAKRSQNIQLRKKLLAKALKTSRGTRNLPPIRTNQPLLKSTGPQAVRKTKTSSEAASGAQRGWRKLYVGDLAETTSINDLRRDFGKFGKINDIWIARNPPGFAFVDFMESKDAARALRNLDGTHRLGPIIKVEFAKKIGPKTSSALVFAARKRGQGFTGRKFLPFHTGDPLSRPRRLSGGRSGPLLRNRRLSGSFGGPPTRGRGNLLLRERGGPPFRDRGRPPIRDREGLFRDRDAGRQPPRRMSPSPNWLGRSPLGIGRSPIGRGQMSRFPLRRSTSPVMRRHYPSPPPMPPMPSLFDPYDPRFREMAVVGGWSRGRSPIMAPPPPLPPRYRSRSPTPPRFRGRSPPNRRSPPGRFNRDRNRGRDNSFHNQSRGGHGAVSLVYPPLSLPPPSFIDMAGISPPRRLRTPPPPPPIRGGGGRPLPSRERPRSPFRRSPPRHMMHSRSPPPPPPIRGRSPGFGGRMRSPPPKRRSPFKNGSPPLSRKQSGGALERMRGESDKRSYRGNSPPQRGKGEFGSRQFSPSPQRMKSGSRVLNSNFNSRLKTTPHRSNSWNSPERKFTPPSMRNHSPPSQRSRSRSPIHGGSMRSPPRPRSPPPEPNQRAWSPRPQSGNLRGARTPPRGYTPPRPVAKSRSPSGGNRFRGGRLSDPPVRSPPPQRSSWGRSPPVSRNSPVRSNNNRNSQQLRERTPPRGYTPPRGRSPPPRYNKLQAPLQRGRSPPLRGRGRGYQTFNPRMNRR